MIKEEHKYANQTVKINAVNDINGISNVPFVVEDWWINVSGRSWMICNGNPACLEYAMRSVGLPIDNEVVYGKSGDLGYLVHNSEILGLWDEK